MSTVPAPTEEATTFECEGDALVGVFHRPAVPLHRGVVIVVGGGPQYRAGGHRQLTLWARALSARGYPVLRFDYRGMGDAHGEFRGFMQVDEDTRCAIDHLMALQPGLREVVLWGECDASSAILYYAHRDARVKGAVLLNPWVRTEAGQARTLLRSYYVNRLLQPSLWKKLLSGRFDVAGSLRSAIGLLRQSRAAKAPAAAGAVRSAAPGPISRELPLTEGLLIGMQRFQGPLLLVLSGRDLIAREFEQLLRDSSSWREALAAKALTRHDLPEGDHTFSSAELRAQVLAWGVQWLEGW